MDLLCIETKCDIYNIEKILNENLDFLKEKIDIDRKIDKIDDTFFIKYKLSESDKKNEKYLKVVFRDYISNAICDIIFKIYQDKIIDRQIFSSFSYLDKEEKEKVKHKTTEYLRKNEYLNLEGIILKVNKRTKILKEILEYLENNDTLNIDGFVNFRLKFYIDTIKDALEKNVEDFFIEKEYREFIKILQYFVEIQEPKLDELNIIFRDEKYELIDNRNRLINDEFMQEIANELYDIDINYDDLLISSLITIAPKKIKIHLEDDIESDIINIIKNVFIDKVTICDGCELCGFSVLMESSINKEK
ncbi:sporulation protein YtxC [Gottschalkia purinilytica]|uniref:Sporulation protein YtxC n=1 Tax=Gottschalkia purinilytica TaxID=1503 RepID=A0A0L0W7J5_GOTPU|nr:putative sporulation protein YtxC [Gottschalkia purinilytica]KNF07479.1 sporulation protein YtxC [Gottschalkia purinilytica]